MDEDGPSTMNGHISAAYYNHNCVIIFENYVKPSMITGMHYTKTCFNANSIVASS